MDTLHVDLSTFVIADSWTLLRINKCFGHTFCVHWLFSPPESLLLWDNVAKYSAVRQATNANTYGACAWNAG